MHGPTIIRGDADQQLRKTWLAAKALREQRRPLSNAVRNRFSWQSATLAREAREKLAIVDRLANGAGSDASADFHQAISYARRQLAAALQYALHIGRMATLRRPSGTSEADEMVWKGKPSPTKTIHVAQRSKRMARRLDQRKAQATRRYSEQQRRALAAAQSRLAADLAIVLADLLRRSATAGRTIPPGEISRVAAQLAREAAAEGMGLVLASNASGVPPTMGGVVARGFMLLARRRGWPEGEMALAAEAIGQSFDAAASGAMKAMIVAVAAILPFTRGGGDKFGDVELQEMELAA